MPSKDPTYLEPGDILEDIYKTWMYLVCSYPFSVIDTSRNHKKGTVVHEAILFKNDESMPKFLVVNFSNADEAGSIFTRRQSLVLGPAESD